MVRDVNVLDVDHTHTNIEESEGRKEAFVRRKEIKTQKKKKHSKHKKHRMDIHNYNSTDNLYHLKR